MSRIGLIDVGEWQTTVDFRTGALQETAHQRVDLTREVLRRHPYPGDMTPHACRWVTDVALEMDACYAPDFMLLVYANAFFPAVFSPTSEAICEGHRQEVFDEIERFLAATGFDPVIVGTGDLIPLAGTIDMTHLDGFAVAGGMAVRCAGLEHATPRDLEVMAQHPGVERIVTRDEFREQFGGCEGFYQRFPERLLVAKEGFIFRGVGTGGRPLYRVPARDRQIPLHTRFGKAEALTDVAQLALLGLESRRVALIVVEAVGCATFPLSFRPIANALHWYTYAVGEGQYLALATGRHFVERPYPPAYRSYVDDHETRDYPFSGILHELPEDAIGRRFAGRSVAVGSRGILTHAMAGTEIAVECFARALYNHGVMAVVDVGER